MTDPPFLGTAALAVARRFRSPLVVVSQDVFPEIAVELERLTHPLAIGVLRRLVRFYLRRAERVVAIGETMKRRLEAKGAPAGRITVIPNWVDTDTIRPVPSDTAWAVENGLDGAFVVMHSGNVGHAQDLETLVDAAVRLADIDDLAIVVVGSGARKAALEERSASRPCGSSATSPASCSARRSPRDTCTSSASRGASPATSCPAAPTACSPPAGP
jgi:colanic acid biosynthesis glycosyl transferase WcaI